MTQSQAHTHVHTCRPQRQTQTHAAKPHTHTLPLPALWGDPILSQTSDAVHRVLNASSHAQAQGPPTAKTKCPLCISAWLSLRNIKFHRPQIEPLVSVPHPQPVPSVPLPVFPILVTALPPTQLLKPETCSHPQQLLPPSPSSHIQAPSPASIH